MKTVGTVIWSGDRRGAHGGYLVYDPAILELSELEREAAELPPPPSGVGDTGRVRDALRGCAPGGALAHELAAQLEISTHRVNGALHGLMRTGQVRAERLPEGVWTGRRLCWWRYFWVS